MILNISTIFIRGNMYILLRKHFASIKAFLNFFFKIINMWFKILTKRCINHQSSFIEIVYKRVKSRYFRNS